MKDLQFSGVTLKERLTGTVAETGEINVIKISRDGILFETLSRLVMTRQYKIEIPFRKSSIKPTAKVEALLMKRAEGEGNKKITLYQVAAEFMSLSSSDRDLVDEIIENALEDDVPKLQDIDGEARDSKFRADD